MMKSGRAMEVDANLGFWMEDCSTHVKPLEFFVNTSELGTVGARHCRKSSAEEAEEDRKWLQLKTHKMARSGAIFVAWAAIGSSLIFYRMLHYWLAWPVYIAGRDRSFTSTQHLSKHLHVTGTCLQALQFASQLDILFLEMETDCLALKSVLLKAHSIGLNKQCTVI
jgi:hypothetical protein